MFITASYPPQSAGRVVPTTKEPNRMDKYASAEITQGRVISAPAKVSVLISNVKKLASQSYGVALLLQKG